ncbi:coiled-coil domain-containing protein 142 isoform X3 [Peromyscus californicus insignis]|uniref:coiled-coil domain-containing protein 142 isoform X3 n=1 Tax=Peromyscus californicus insignis TaxID=564181 RepID=UPI0022A70EA5|nr:coiled-coil domain-containing protein 142 isoform X3 [Peromyscus californicus insignis]
MARAPRSGGFLPPLSNVPPSWAHPVGAGNERGEASRGGPGLLAAGSVPRPDSDRQPWEPAPASGPMPFTLQRLRTALLRLHREREQLLRARDYARHLQAVVRLLRSSSSASALSLQQLHRDLQLCPSRGSALRLGLRDPTETLLLARPVGLAAQRLDAAIQMQLRALGRAPASLGLTSQLAELLLALPFYHKLQGQAVSCVPGAARPFPAARVLHLLAAERGCQVAHRLAEALGGSGLRDQLRRQCDAERELLPGLLGLIGGVASTDSSGLRLGGPGALWSQYWTLLWAACAQSLDLSVGPWGDPRAVAQQLRQALCQAPLPQECEKELRSVCDILLHQSLLWSWDHGFCRALGSSLTGQSGPAPLPPTAELLQRLFPPLLDALREPSWLSPEGSLWTSSPPGPAPVALGLCTLQTTVLWFLGRAQQYLAAWAPSSFLLLTQKDLPPLLQAVEELSSLAAEATRTPEVEQQLGLEIQKLAAKMQHLPEESLSLFFQECHKQATQGFKLHMPRGRYWRLRLCPEHARAPSEYAGTVVCAVLEPVLQGLQGLPPEAQAPPLGQALTAVLGAWLDHILTHGIRFSLQGALQLKQDFGVIREVLEQEQWGLSRELRQTLLSLSIFQRLDGALLCLLQQPLPKNPVHRRTRCCCFCNDVQTTELPTSNLNSLESLAPPLRPVVSPAQNMHLLSTQGGGGPSPEAYLAGNQQAWLALRLHQHPRWHLPFLSCLGTSPEP